MYILNGKQQGNRLSYVCRRRKVLEAIFADWDLICLYEYTSMCIKYTSPYLESC